MKPLRVAVVADPLEERWPSMDLVADMLVAQFRTTQADHDVSVELLRPSLPRRGNGVGRYINRFWSYPRLLGSQTRTFDVFHVIDHSYAHLVHVLPPDRTVVTCHDIDAFMPLFNREVIPSRLPKALTRRVLSGLQKAAFVACDSMATRDEVLQYQLIPAQRLSVVPIGGRPGFLPDSSPAPDASIDALLGPRRDDRVDLLHVGSCIPRKRIDLLLEIFLAVREREPRARLLKAGGVFTAKQLELVRALGLTDHVVQLPFLEPDQLAALYRRATSVLLTSEREGFGLPVIEAMACGTRVIATDLKVLREVGGGAALYCPLGGIEQWRDTILGVVRERHDQTAIAKWRAAGVAQAAIFSWKAYAASMAAIYARVASIAPRRQVETQRAS